MVNDNTLTKQRIVIHFGKFGALKYTSNLDLAKIWERVLRRANLPILYSQGFNTRPRIQLASALPLGITSESEFVEVALKEIISLDGVREQLARVSPDGLTVYSITDASIHTPALQTLVRTAEYRIHFDDPIDTALLRDRVDALIAADRILKTVERSGRKSAYDLRPLIYDLHLDEHDDLIAHVAAGEHGNVRPDDLLLELQFNDYAYSVHRLKLHLENSK